MEQWRASGRPARGRRRVRSEPTDFRNRHQVLLRHPDYSVVSREAKGMAAWAGFDVIRWAREDPKRALFWYGGTGGFIHPDDAPGAAGG